MIRPNVLDESVISHVLMAVHENPRMEMNLKFLCTNQHFLLPAAMVCKYTHIELLCLPQHLHVTLVNTRPAESALLVVRLMFILIVGFRLVNAFGVHDDTA